MNCATCRELVGECEAASTKFARAVAMMTASVGNADFQLATEIAEKCRLVCSALNKKLDMHRKCHITG